MEARSCLIHIYLGSIILATWMSPWELQAYKFHLSTPLPWLAHHVHILACWNHGSAVHAKLGTMLSSKPGCEPSFKFSFQILVMKPEVNHSLQVVSRNQECRLQSTQGTREVGVPNHAVLIAGNEGFSLLWKCSVTGLIFKCLMLCLLPFEQGFGRSRWLCQLIFLGGGIYMPSSVSVARLSHFPQNCSCWEGWKEAWCSPNAFKALR